MIGAESEAASIRAARARGRTNPGNPQGQTVLELDDDVEAVAAAARERALAEARNHARGR